MTTNEDQNDARAPGSVHRLKWWLCPNEPRCGHGAVFHDIEDFDDPSPRCCFEGCACGALGEQE